MQETQPSQTEETPQRWSPAWMAAGAVTLVVAILLGYGLIARPALPPQVGEPVPDIQLTAFDGSPMTLADLGGQVVVVNFFASWCAPCREEAADLEQAWRDYQGRGVQFLGIAYKDAESKAQAFLDEFGVSYPSTTEPGNRTARAYGVTGVPETFIIDPQGRLVLHVLGPISAEELGRELDRLVNP